MLHTLFFVLSLVTNSQVVADALYDCTLLGLANSGVLCVVATCLAARNWRSKGRGGRRTARAVRGLCPVLEFQK
jgi:hypothetical protein